MSDAVPEKSMLGLRQASEVKKCSWCCKSLNVDCFATNPKTAALYSKCEECRPKHASTCNSSANAAVVKRAYAKSEKGKERNKRYAESEKGKERNKRYAESEKGKEANKRYDESEKGKATEKRYHESEKGKERNKRAKTSEKGKATQKRYAESEKGKEADKRYREGDAGQANAKRFAANRQDRRRASTAMRIDHTIHCASNGLISGRRKKSPKFVKLTGFASEASFLAAVRATFQPGMTFSNHGAVWELDHKIPREAYDFDDPEDVRRCWSAKNVHALTVADNAEKSWKMVDQYILEAGLECLPVAWKGQFPDADFKIAHAAKMMARKILEDEAAEEEQPSNSNGAMEEAPDSDSD